MTSTLLNFHLTRHSSKGGFKTLVVTRASRPCVWLESEKSSNEAISNSVSHQHGRDARVTNMVLKPLLGFGDAAYHKSRDLVLALLCPRGKLRSALMKINTGRRTVSRYATAEICSVAIHLRKCGNLRKVKGLRCGWHRIISSM